MESTIQEIEKQMIIKPAKRTESVQEYYFSRKLKEIALMNEQRAVRGEDPVINLGIGSPDGMPPMAAVEVLEYTLSERRITLVFGSK